MLKHSFNQAFDPLADPQFSQWVVAFVKDGFEEKLADKVAGALLSHRRVMQALERSYLEDPDPPMALMNDEFLSKQVLAAFMKVNKCEQKTLINILSLKAKRGSEVTQLVKLLAKLNRYLQKCVVQLSKALKT